MPPCLIMAAVVLWLTMPVPVSGEMLVGACRDVMKLVSTSLCWEGIAAACCTDGVTTIGISKAFKSMH